MVYIFQYITFVLVGFQGDPYDSLDEEWNVSFHLTNTWNRPIRGGIPIGLDANANINEPIHDAFIMVNMIHDEGMQRMLEGLEDYVE